MKGKESSSGIVKTMPEELVPNRYKGLENV